MQNNNAYHTNFCRIDRLKFVEIGKDDHPPCAHFKNASASLGAVFDKRSESSNITSPGWMSREVLQCSVLRKRAPLSTASSKIYRPRMKKQNSPNREEAFLLPTRRQRLSQGLVRCDQLIRLAVKITACVSSRLSTHLSESESDASSAEMNQPKLRYRGMGIAAAGVSPMARCWCSMAVL